MIKVEQSAEPHRFTNGAFGAIGWLIGEGDDIVQSLMISFLVKVTQILVQRAVQGTFAEENQLIETFILDSTHPPFF